MPQQPPQGNQAPHTAGPVIAVTPRVPANVQQLEIRRSELRSQLQSLTERRMLLSMQIGQAEGAAKVELTSRIKALDDRTARIDDELNRIDDAVNKALANGADVRVEVPVPIQTIVRGGNEPVVGVPGLDRRIGDIEDMSGASLAIQSTGFILILFFLWRLARRKPSAPAKLASEDASRIDQLQRAVDVIAVEVERISESQRYIAKVMSERGALGAGAAQDIPVARRESEPAKKARG